MEGLIAQTTTVNLLPQNNFSTIGGLQIGNIVSFLITAVLIIAGVVFVFMLLIGGIRWIVSGGDKTGTEAARGQITAALIGLVIVFSAFAIINLLATVFNITLLQLDFGTVATSGAG